MEVIYTSQSSSTTSSSPEASLGRAAAPSGTPSAAPAAAIPIVGKADKYIWAVYIFLCILSIIEIFSASSREVTSTNIFGPIVRQCLHLAIDTAIVYAISRVNYRWFIPFIPLFILLSVALMCYVLVAGDIINGARRSFTIFGFTMQPSEMIKMSAVLGIALIMSRNQVPQGVKTRGVVLSALLVCVCGGLLFSQGLTNTLLLMGISLAMMLIAGIEFRKFILVLVAYAIVGAGGMFYKMDKKEAADAAATEQADRLPEINQAGERQGTWVARIKRYLGDGVPLYEKEITPENRQEVYGYMAQANGGMFGVLPGNSRETSRLPLAFSDYIFSIVVEDWGFVGGLVLLIAYLSLMARAGNIASRCTRAFPAFLVLGMAVMITLQALFHMAIVTGVFPVSGQPLPMISKGGSSMLVTAIAFGIMLSVSRFAVRSGSKKQDIKDEKEALPTTINADNPTMIGS